MGRTSTLLQNKIGNAKEFVNRGQNNEAIKVLEDTLSWLQTIDQNSRPQGIIGDINDAINGLRSGNENAVRLVREIDRILSQEDLLVSAIRACQDEQKRQARQRLDKLARKFPKYAGDFEDAKGYIQQGEFRKATMLINNISVSLFGESILQTT